MSVSVSGFGRFSRNCHPRRVEAFPLACQDCAHVRHAVITIMEKEQDICTEQGWEYLPIALPHSVMKLVLELQHAQF